MRPAFRLSLVLLLTLICAPAESIVGREHALQGAKLTADTFFTTTKVWDVRLSLASEDWQAMQPRSSGSFGGGFGQGRSMLGPPGGRNGVAARQGIEFDYVHADLQIDDWRLPDVGLRYKGNGSYLRSGSSGKISLKVDVNRHVKGQKFAGLTTLNFQNNITDAGWMNEVVAYQLYRDAGAPAPRTAYARVYLTVRGQTERFLGVYSISENVDEDFIEARFGTRLGAIFKPSTNQPFTFLGPDWAAYNQTYDPKTELTSDEKQHIIDLGNLVSSASDTDFAARVGDFVDLDAFARYMAVLVWIANPDSLLQIGQNYYTYLHPTTHKLHFIAWDQDFSFGNFRNNTTQWTIHRPWSGTNLFLSRVYAVDSFRSAYLKAMAEYSATIFKPERFEQQISTIAPAIRPSIATEGGQWLPGFDQVATGQTGIVPYARERAAFVAGELLTR